MRPTVSVSVPSTAQPTSKPGTASSTITELSYRNAASTAVPSASRDSTRVTPKDEPARTGFTNTGKESVSRIFCRVSAVFSSSTTDFGTAIPARETSLCARSLSMQSAEASVPHPTSGIPESSKSPCTVPSSPFFPCSTGKARSIRRSIHLPLWSSQNPGAPRLGEKAAGRRSMGSSTHVPAAMAL